MAILNAPDGMAPRIPDTKGRWRLPSVWDGVLPTPAVDPPESDVPPVVVTPDVEPTPDLEPPINPPTEPDDPTEGKVIDRVFTAEQDQLPMGGVTTQAFAGDWEVIDDTAGPIDPTANTAVTFDVPFADDAQTVEAQAVNAANSADVTIGARAARGGGQGGKEAHWFRVQNNEMYVDGKFLGRIAKYGENVTFRVDVSGTSWSAFLDGESVMSGTGLTRSGAGSRFAGMRSNENGGRFLTFRAFGNAGVPVEPQLPDPTKPNDPVDPTGPTPPSPVPTPPNPTPTPHPPNPQPPTSDGGHDSRLVDRTPAWTDPESGYVLKRVGIGAGGFVPYMALHPTDADARYIGTDVGGAYAWRENLWRQILTHSGVDADTRPDQPNRPTEYSVDMYPIEGIATASTDSQRVSFTCGNDEQTQNGRLVTSIDGGRTCRIAPDELFVAGNAHHNKQTSRVAHDPFSADVILAGTRKQGLRRWDDGGLSLSTQVNGIPVGKTPSMRGGWAAGVLGVMPDPSAGKATNGLCARWYVAVAGEGVFLSTDGTDTWRNLKQIEDQIHPLGMQVMPNGDLLVSFCSTGWTQKGSIQKFIAAENRWHRYVVQDGFDGDLMVATANPFDPDEMMVCNDGAVRRWGVRVTTNGGKTWQEIRNETDSSDSIPWIGEHNDGGYMPVGRVEFSPSENGRIWFAEGLGVWTVDFHQSLADGKLVWHLDASGIEEVVMHRTMQAPGGAPLHLGFDFGGTVKPTEPDVIPAHQFTPTDEFSGGVSAAYQGQDSERWAALKTDYHRYGRRTPGVIVSDGGTDDKWEELPIEVSGRNMGRPFGGSQDILDRDMWGGEIAIDAEDPNVMLRLATHYVSPFAYLTKKLPMYRTLNGGRRFDDWEMIEPPGEMNSAKSDTGKFDEHQFMFWPARMAMCADHQVGGRFYLSSNDARFYVTNDAATSWQRAPHSPQTDIGSDARVYGALRHDPFRQRLWIGAGTNGLWWSDDAGQTKWNRVPGLDRVASFGFGAPVGDAPVTLFAYGNLVDESRARPRVYRSIDEGQSWTFVTEYPMDLFKPLNGVDGDLDVPGRCYLHFGGCGSVFGDDPEISA